MGRALGVAEQVGQQRPELRSVVWACVPHLPRLGQAHCKVLDAMILPGQLGGGQAHQHLPGRVSPRPGLDRPHRPVQRLDHPELLTPLADRDHARHRRQRLIRRADPHPPPRALATA
ncbi:MAG TPA: hypothetical protein VFQ77_03250 [Pseudonocardiaceae bacterium]|nr:hypothetical protein [Pseudonocardiaceae bacterium]